MLEYISYHFFFKQKPIAQAIIFGLDRQRRKITDKSNFSQFAETPKAIFTCLQELVSTSFAQHIPQRVTRATFKIERDTCLGRKSRNISPAPNPRDAAAGESIYQQRELALGAARCQKAPKHNKLSLFARDLLEQKAAWSGAGALVSLLLGAKPRK
jgi:hypothetical protein